MGYAQCPHGFDGEEIKFVRVGATADPGDRFQAIRGATGRVFFHERGVTRFLHPPADFIERGIPRDVVPMIGTGTAHLRLGEAPLVENIVVERSAFRAQCAAIDRMIRIAFHVNDLRRGVFRFVAERVNNYAATYRAVGACRARLARARDLQFFELRVSGREIESENGGDGCSADCDLNKIAAGRGHREILPTFVGCTRTKIVARSANATKTCHAKLRW